MFKLELVSAVIGFLIRGVIYEAVREKFTKPFVKVVFSEIEQWPKIQHYLFNHEGKSYHCVACKSGATNSIDSIT